MPPIDPRLPQRPGAPMPEEQQEPVDNPQEEGQEPPLEDVGAQDVPTGGLDGAMKQASPEEQAAVDKIVAKGMELIYNDNIFPHIVEMLKGGADGETEGDPVKGLAAATDMVVARLANAAETAGETLDPVSLYHAGASLLEDLAEVSRRGKIKDYSQDPQALESAWFQALDLFRERLQGADEIDQADAQAGLETLKRADADGSLERTMRQIADSDRAGQAGGTTDEEQPPAEPPARGRGFAAAMGAQ